MGHAMLIGDISSGNTATADVLFLVSLVLFIVGAIAYFATSTVTKFAPVIVALGLGALALGFLVL